MDGWQWAKEGETKKTKLEISFWVPLARLLCIILVIMLSTQGLWHNNRNTTTTTTYLTTATHSCGVWLRGGGRTGLGTAIHVPLSTALGKTQDFCRSSSSNSATRFAIHIHTRSRERIYIYIERSVTRRGTYGTYTSTVTLCIMCASFVYIGLGAYTWTKEERAA